MSKRRKSATAIELVKIMNKPYASTEDIKILGDVGESNALKYKRDITDTLKDENVAFGKTCIPMEYVIKMLNVPEEQIRRQAMEELKLQQEELKVQIAQAQLKQLGGVLVNG